MPRKENLRLFTSVLHPNCNHKKQKKLKRGKVLKMLAIMAQQSAGPSNGTDTPALPPECATATHSQEFLATGRTGRRNAMPDILGEHAVVTSSDLPIRLQSLSTSDPEPSTAPDNTAELSKPNS